MALTETEKLQCKMLLRVPANASTDLDALLGGLSAAQEAEVQGILAKFNADKLDADTIKAEGLDSSPARTEAKLRRLLALAVGWRVSDGLIRIARA